MRASRSGSAHVAHQKSLDAVGRRAHTGLMSMQLLLQAETEGLETEEEAVELAEWMVATGLANSTGSYQRFVESVLG